MNTTALCTTNLGVCAHLRQKLLSNESKTHLRSGQCEVYGDLKDKYPNLDDDNQLAMFFSTVLERRTKLEEQEKRTEDALVEGISTDSS